MDKRIVFANEVPRQTISDRLRREEIRRLAPGVYTSDTTSTPEAVVNRDWLVIVGRLFPNAVITDRSATTGGKVDGYLYLAHDARNRELTLPGLIVLARRGAGPIEGDFPMPGGLMQASRGRALAENARPSRSRSGRPRRTLNIDELATWIDRICKTDGEDKLQQHRIQAERLANRVGAASAQMATLSKMVGAALGTQRFESANSALNARQRGEPFDQDRVNRFDALATALRSAAPQSRPGLTAGSKAFAVQSFYEAYFSNYIEGTIFTVEEAKALLFDGKTPTGRTADGHDVTGTYQIVADHEEMSAKADTANEFVDLLRSRHAVLMAGRPEDNPGSFKLRPNQVGNTLFVDPVLVEGTLREGFQRLTQLDSAWERAVFLSFLVAEVHPFKDGNGRIARVMMNAVLVRGDQSKIIVPTGFRSDYLTSLRRLSRQDDPSVFVKAMRYLHDYTSQIDWSTHETAENDLRATNAFEEEVDSPRLQLLRSLDQPLILPPELSTLPEPSYVAPYVRNGRPVSGYRRSL